MTTPKPVQLTLCADDYGASTGIDRAIDALLHAGRLSAVSCLANGPSWRADGRHLARWAGPVSVGLHLNLTEGRPLSAALAQHWPTLPRLPALMRDAFLRRLPLEAIGAEIAAQWQAFVEVAGREPGHVDGHQHVHALPGVRERLVAAIAARPTRPWVRSTAHLPGPGFLLKRELIRRCGGAALHGLLRRHGLAHNTALLGSYDLREPDYRALMARWLSALPARGTVIFCHPGSASPDGWPDVIAPARAREAEVLASAAFGLMLASRRIALVPTPA